MDPLRGRGATANPPNRFERLQYHTDEWCEPDSAERRIETQFFRDDSQSVISYNQSPDIGFEASLNPYRGCEHGCAYCYARPTHEFLGFSAGIDFETKIMVKPRAAELLRQELSSKRWQPQCLVLSGVTDCYQPIEKKLGITRACLEVLTEFRNPVAIVTKNYLVTRDTDLLSELAQYQAAGVSISLTTLDKDLGRLMEPRASGPIHRLEAIAKLREAAIPVGVGTAPIIPGLNDHEIPDLLRAAAEAGAQFASFTMLRLPLTVAPVFLQWLETHFPDRNEKILSRIRAMRNGKLNSSEFGKRMRGEGVLADQIRQLFQVSCRRFGLDRPRQELSTASFRRVAQDQMELF
jgi:DNA repair photolyase